MEANRIPFFIRNAPRFSAARAEVAEANDGLEHVHPSVLEKREQDEVSLGSEQRLSRTRRLLPPHLRREFEEKTNHQVEIEEESPSPNLEDSATIVSESIALAPSEGPEEPPSLGVQVGLSVAPQESPQEELGWLVFGH